MIVELIARNYKPTNGLKEIINKKFSKLDKYFDDSIRCKVILKELNGEKCVMEAKIILDKSRVICAKQISQHMYDNIDLIIPKIEGQIRKLKTIHAKKLRTSIKEEIATKRDNKTDKLSRTKQIELKKISLEDAIYERDMIDKDFYVFINEKTNLVNVVYLRDDGDVGLLDLVY